MNCDSIIFLLPKFNQFMSVRELSQSDKLSMNQPPEEYSELLNMFSLS